MTQIQFQPAERWTASCCALYKRVRRSFTFDRTGKRDGGPAINDPRAQVRDHRSGIILVPVEFLGNPRTREI